MHLWWPHRIIAVCCLLVLWITLSRGLTAHGQVTAARYLVDEWQTDQGLPQNIVKAVTQTADGYLWCGTTNGLARFDGIQFKIFNTETTPELGSARVRQLFTDRQGTLWISTIEGGLVQYKNRCFTAFTLPLRATTQRAIAAFADDPSGTLWMSADDGAVIRFDGKEFTTVSSVWDPSSTTVYRVLNDPKGNTWVVSRLALARLDNGQLVPVLNGAFGQYEFLAPSRNGGWWINMGGRVRLWRDGQYIAERGAPAWINRLVASCVEDHAGHLWIGSSGGGLYRYDADGSVHRFSANEGLGSDLICSLCEDTEGDLWVGTNGGGLSRLRLALFNTYGRAQGLSSSLVTAITEGKDGELWIGTADSGINLLKDGAVRAMGAAEGLEQLQVQTALSDQSGQLWVGTAPGGLFRYDSNRFTRVPLPAGYDGPTRSLFEDSKQRLWIGQQSLSRLLNFEKSQFHFLNLPNPTNGLDINCMIEDPSGALWIGTDGSGLFQYSLGKFKQFRRAEGLPSDIIRSLHADPDGTIWIGTQGGGITRLKNEHFVSCSKGEGLPDNVINSIQEDAMSNFWLSSFHGIFRVPKRDLNEFADGNRPSIQCVQFGKSDGLPAMECAGGFQPASCKTRDGRLWFPTVKGVAVVDPARWRPNPVAPPVFIEEVRIDGAIQALPDPASTANRAMLIPPGTQRYEIQYTGLNFSAPERVQFKYRLEGLDKDWVQAGHRRTAIYSYLPPGKYCFHVIACNQDGLWNNVGAAFSLVIQPQLWQRWSFRIPVSALVALGFAGIIRAVTRRRWRSRLRQLETQQKVDNERTRIAQDIHDDLGAGLTQIAWLGEATAKHAHQETDVRIKAHKISAAAREMVRSLDEIVWAVRPENDSLSSLVDYLGRRVDELFENSGTRCWFTASKNLPQLVVLAELRHNIYLTCKEALNNALKHSGGSEVLVDVTFANNQLTINITDNGVGFDAMDNLSAGNGLKNMRARIENIGGKFIAHSQIKIGTRIELTIPMAPADPA